MGIIPQRDRRPRLIIDYSYWGINDETELLSPKESMQFGRTLERSLFTIRHANPRYGPVHQAKVDLSDGFYRERLNVQDIPHLGVAFPTYEGEEPMVAFPLVLPMGWIESPPWFCAATETVADLANALPADQEFPVHFHAELSENLTLDIPLAE